MRWPGKIKAGSVANGIVQHHDWLPTFLAMAAEPDVVEKLRKGHQAIGRTYKNHIDGYNLLPYLTGEAKDNPRNFFFYFSDDGDVSVCASTTGRSCLWNSVARARWRSGAIPSRGCPCQRSSTCALTPMSSRM